MIRELIFQNRSLNLKIKRLIEPLKHLFPFTYFWYYSIRADGEYTCLGNRQDWIEFYFQNQIFLDNPFLRDPHFFPEGIFFTRSVQDSKYQKALDCGQPFHIDNTVLILRKEGGVLHGFGFGSTNQGHYSLFSNEISLLKQFILYFKRQANRMTEEAETLFLPQFLGEKFFEAPSLGLSSSTRKKFLHSLDLSLPSLSDRERECLELYWQGFNARQTAEKLGLSRRTIETHFEYLKAKFGCEKKSELFEKKALLP